MAELTVWFDVAVISGAIVGAVAVSPYGAFAS
jgi:hypothetical protein